MRFNIFTLLSLLLFSSIGAAEKLETCEFNSQLGSSICYSKTEEKPYQILADLLQPAVDNYIQEYEKTLLKKPQVVPSLFGMYSEVRADFFLTEEKTSEVLWQLKSHLTSFDEYLLHQKEVIKIIFLTFHAVGENPAVFHEFAEEVFSILSQFLHSSFVAGKQPASHITGVESRHYMSVANKFDDKSQASGELHAYMVFLTNSLGKKLKSKDLAHRTSWAVSFEFPDYSLEQIEKAFQYLDLVWLHGSKAYSLKSAHLNTEDCFVPSGVLFKKKVAVLTGTIDAGASPIGVNRESLSGLGLSGYSEAIDYAGRGNYSVELEETLLDQFLNLDLGLRWQDYVDYDGRFTRLRVAISRVRRNNVELFEAKREAIEEKLTEIYQALTVNVFGIDGNSKLKKYFFDWHDSYYSSKFYSYLKVLNQLVKDVEEPVASSAMIQEEQDELLSTIPIVIGSLNRLGLPIYINAETSKVEQIYSGSLKLGEEIQVIFVYDKDLLAVEELVREIGLEERVTVESMSTLDLVGEIEQYLFSYLYDPYVLPDSNMVDWFNHAVEKKILFNSK